MFLQPAPGPIICRHHSLAGRARVSRWTDAGVSQDRLHTRASVLTTTLLAPVHLLLAVLPRVSIRTLAHIVPGQIPAHAEDTGLLDTLVHVLLAVFARPSRDTCAGEEIEEIRARAVVQARLGNTHAGAGASQLRLCRPANSDELGHLRRLVLQASGKR